MRIRLAQFLLAPVTSLFCMLAFSSTLPNAGQDLSYGSSGQSGVFFPSTVQTGNPGAFDVVAGRESATQKPLLLADTTDTTVQCDPNSKSNTTCICHYYDDGKWHTQPMSYEEAIDKSTNDPDHWVMGKCVEEMSGQ
jgi:hypothetical protein